jgi:hypothetical protein
LHQKQRVPEAVKILYENAGTMLKHSEIASGLDLSKKLMEWVKGEDSDIGKVTYQDRIVALCELIPVGNPLKIGFLKHAMKWTSHSGQYPKGYPKLHWQYARELLACSPHSKEEIQAAKYHFALAMPDATFDLIEYLMTQQIKSHGDQESSFEVLELLLYILKEKQLKWAKFFFDQFCKIYESYYAASPDIVVEHLDFPIEFVVYSNTDPAGYPKKFPSYL